MITPIKVPKVKLIKETSLGKMFREIIEDIEVRAIQRLQQNQLEKTYPEFVNKGRFITKEEAELPI
jgi:hypothetical protein